MSSNVENMDRFLYCLQSLQHVNRVCIVLCVATWGVQCFAARPGQFAQPEHPDPKDPKVQKSGCFRTISDDFERFRTISDKQIPGLKQLSHQE